MGMYRILLIASFCLLLTQVWADKTTCCLDKDCDNTCTTDKECFEVFLPNDKELRGCQDGVGFSLVPWEQVKDMLEDDCAEMSKKNIDDLKLNSFISVEDNKKTK